MMIHSLLSRYIISEYLRNFLLLLGMLLGVIVLFDIAELMRRSANIDNISFAVIAQMALFKLPEAGAEVFPFAVLLAAIYSFWSLSKRHELVILRNAGLSAWQFILPMSAAAFSIGLLYIAVLNPISSSMLTRFQNLESIYLGEEKKLVTISKTGLWLKQNGYEEDSYAHAIFHTGRINLENWVMRDVVVTFIDEEDNFIRRIDSESALLEDGKWILQNAYINGRYGERGFDEQIQISTTLTRQDIIDSFSDPQLVSFWALPEYIALMKAAGIATRAIRMHYYTLLIQPIFYAVLILLAASFCLKPPRFQNGLHLAALTIISTFGLFFLTSLLKALGGAEQLPVVLAALAPSLITALLSTNIIMHTEDG